MQSQDVLSTFLLFLIGTVAVFAVERTFSRRERGLIWLGFAGHVMAALAMVWVTMDVLGGGDMTSYHIAGTRLAEAMRLDFWDVAPDVLSVMFHENVPLPVPIHGIGSASGTMYCLSAFLFLAIGDSLYAACMAMGIASFFARLVVYRVLREHVEEPHWPAMAIASLLVPSVTFWCSGLLKESFAFCGLAALFWGANAMLQRRSPVLPGLVGVAGVLLVGVVKPYVLMPAGIGIAGWVYFTVARRGKASLRNLWALPAATVVGLVAVLVVGELFPRYSFMNLPEETTYIQQIYQLRTSGESKIVMMDDPSAMAPEERGFASQLAYAPLAIFTALFRPSLLDVKNAQMLVNALEVTVFSVLFVLVVVRNRVRDFFQALYARPILAFCVLFVLGMSLGVGLATANLGSMSRYRTPMIPFFAAWLVLGLRWRELGKPREPVAPPAPAPARTLAPRPVAALRAGLRARG